ncbi:O-antigen ligase family protein [Phocaeicola sp.]
MIAGIVLTILFSIMLLSNYKRIVVLIAMTVQLLSYIGTGIPSVKMYFALSILAMLLYFPNKIRLSKDKYPKWLTAATIIFLLSFAITTITSDYIHWQTVVVNAFAYFGFPFVLWKCLDSKKQVDYAIKVLVAIMTIATLIGAFEAFFRFNPVYNIMQSVLVSEDFSFDDDRVRYGLKRCNSIFAYFTTYGIATFMAFVTLYVKGFILKGKSRWLPYLMFLCAFASFSTGSRAIFLGLFLALFMLLVEKRFLKTKTGIAIIVISFLLLPVLLEVGYQVLDSMVNSDTSKYASGSTSELRDMQWEICLPYFLNSPIVGNGRMYIWDTVKEANYGLLGAESIWFSILVDYGLFGGFAFLFMIFACCKHLYAYNLRLICLPIGYLLILSLSPDTGVTYNTILSFTVLILRMFQFSSFKNNDRNTATIKRIPETGLQTLSSRRF